MLERIRSPTIDAKVTRGIWLGELFLAAIGHLLEKRTARRSRKFTSSVVPRRVTTVDSIRDAGSATAKPSVCPGTTSTECGQLAISQQLTSDAGTFAVSAPKSRASHRVI